MYPKNLVLEPDQYMCYIDLQYVVFMTLKAQCIYHRTLKAQCITIELQIAPSVVPTKSDSDVIFCLQLLCKTLTLHTI